MTTALLDVNVLLALVWRDHSHHGPARAFARTLGDWSTTPFTEAGFLRLSTTTAVVGAPVALAEAMERLRTMTADRRHHFWADDVPLTDDRVRLSWRSRNDVTDGHLVAVAARHGGELATFDTRIPKLVGRSDRHLVRVLPGR